MPLTIIKKRRGPRTEPWGTPDITFFELDRTELILAICQKSREPDFSEVMESYFINICTFGSFKNPFVTITSLSELYLRFKITLLVHMNKAISRKYGSFTSMACISSWKPWKWVSPDLILSMRDIYTSFPTRTHSQNSLAAAKALSLNISSHGTSLK